MKKIIVLTLCFIASGMAFAQQSATPQKGANAAQKRSSVHNNGISGHLTDARNVPILGARAFVYGTDSSGAIVSSGYTDSMGYYESGYTSPGKYNLKLVYPTEKTVMVNSVIVKKGMIDISLRMNSPEADTTLPYTMFLPKPVEKKRVKKTP